MNKTLIQSRKGGSNEDREEEEVSSIDEKFNSFQLGVSIALSVMGTLIAIGCVYAVIQMRR